jgi:imidazolonepropionase-like amidohydrolase
MKHGENVSRLARVSELLRCALALLALGAFAAFGPGERAHALQSEGGAESEAEGEEKKDDDESKAVYFALVGGDVYTGLGEVLRGATLLSRNGLIHRIGYELELPEGTQQLDVRGMRVYPGLIAFSASSAVAQGGMSEYEAEPQTMRCCGDYGQPGHVHDEEEHAEQDGNEDGHEHEGDGEAGGDALQAEGEDEQSTLGDSYDPFSLAHLMALSVGITSVEQSGAALKLKRGEIAGVVMREKFLATFAWSSVSGGQSALRAKFRAAAAYLRELRAFEARKDKSGKEPSKRGIDPKVVAVLKNEVRAKFNANTRGDLLEIAQLAQEFGFRPVFDGCAEGWTVAEELGRAGATAIVTPRTRRDPSEELVKPHGSSIENAAILHRHGVQVVVAPSSGSIDLGGITGRDLMAFAVDGAFAIRGGLPELAALQAMTLIPARTLGVEHRVGSLEVGKDCDAIVLDGDVFHYESHVQYSVVAGKVAYDKQKELLFHHIRPRATSEPATSAPTPESAPASGPTGG